MSSPTPSLFSQLHCKRGLRQFPFKIPPEQHFCCYKSLKQPSKYGAFDCFPVAQLNYIVCCLFQVKLKGLENFSEFVVEFFKSAINRSVPEVKENFSAEEMGELSLIGAPFPLHSWFPSPYSLCHYA